MKIQTGTRQILLEVDGIVQGDSRSHEMVSYLSLARRIAVAVDGSTSSKVALMWAVKHWCCSSDSIFPSCFSCFSFPFAVYLRFCFLPLCMFSSYRQGDVILLFHCQPLQFNPGAGYGAEKTFQVMSTWAILNLILSERRSRTKQNPQGRA